LIWGFDSSLMHIEKNLVEMLEFTLYSLKKFRGRLVIANDDKFFGISEWLCVFVGTITKILYLFHRVSN
jgi:hypothetical protein